MVYIYHGYIYTNPMRSHDGHQQAPPPLKIWILLIVRPPLATISSVSKNQTRWFSLPNFSQSGCMFCIMTERKKMFTKFYPPPFEV